MSSGSTPAGPAQCRRRARAGAAFSALAQRGWSHEWAPSVPRQSRGPLPLAAPPGLVAAAGQILWPPEGNFHGRIWADRTGH